MSNQGAMLQIEGALPLGNDLRTGWGPQELGQGDPVAGGWGGGERELRSPDGGLHHSHVPGWDTAVRTQPGSPVIFSGHSPTFAAAFPVPAGGRGGWRAPAASTPPSAVGDARCTPAGAAAGAEGWPRTHPR
eukprot:scaffold2664_cov117-Isochrysis_galbana.AAC.6